ncbi:MAG: PEP-CTERM sorting domain-containing protein [Myxococcota bacterium]|nr:PEP-CTERM sorting domain-containing protein [Myxococcota bacterium]
MSIVNGVTAIVSGASSVTLIADITLTVDAGAATVNGVFISFTVDENFGDELNVTTADEIAAVNLTGMGNQFAPITPGTIVSEGAGTALIEQFDQSTLATGAAAGTTVTLGSITFTTNNANLVGDSLYDVRAVVLINGLDVISDSTGGRCIGNLPRNDCPYEFGQLSVTAPEPTTAALVVVGLGIGLFYSRRH